MGKKSTFQTDSLENNYIRRRTELQITINWGILLFFIIIIHRLGLERRFELKIAKTFQI